jgi:hypothetical protein
MHHQFQPAPRVEARRPAIGMGQRLRLHCRVAQGGPFRLEEREVRHFDWRPKSELQKHKQDKQTIKHQVNGLGLDAELNPSPVHPEFIG